MAGKERVVASPADKTVFWRLEALRSVAGPDVVVRDANETALKRSSEDVTDDNSVKTTIYMAWNFLPRSFLLQFRRVGNVYFSVIVVIMLLGSYTNLFKSPQKPWGNLFVVIVIFGLNMTSEYFDDRARARKDRETNSRETLVFSKEHGDFVMKEWRDIKRGDFIKVERDGVFPADIIIINTSDPELDSVCYIQTANIDGETHLKKRVCHPMILPHVQTLNEMRMWLEGREFVFESPNSTLSSFAVFTKNEDGTQIELSSENAILRDSELRNTDWVVGLVIFTGKHTKLLQSQGKRKIKQSTVDRTVNIIIRTVLVLLGILLLSSVLLVEFYFPGTETLWYMAYTSESEGVILPSFLSLLLTYLVLYRQILPILLYAVQEGMNVIQSKYIRWDLNMYDEGTERFASCNTTSLAQEIGQVQWIFSDKTGTLTRNEMRLVSFVVGNDKYGRSSNDDLKALAECPLSPLNTVRLCFRDALVKMREENEESVEVKDFLRALALCHTVLVEGGPSGSNSRKDTTRRLRRRDFSNKVISSDAQESQKTFPLESISSSRRTLHASGESDQGMKEESPKYNAESPDEEALVFASAALGVEYAYSKNQGTVGLQLRTVAFPANENGHKSCKFDNDDFGVERDDDGVEDNVRGKEIQLETTEEWDVLAVNPFSSDRKRMSVLYKRPEDDALVLLCKGADNQMLSVGKIQNDEEDRIRDNLNQYARQGLRTLVVGQRLIGEEEYVDWSTKHAEACSLKGRDRKRRLEEVAIMIETNLQILGITAVEDRLQEGVADTVQTLRKANINFWLITGDKVETAMNISRSAELINDKSQVKFLTASKVSLNQSEEDGPAHSEEEIQTHLIELLSSYLQDLGEQAEELAEQIMEQGKAKKHRLMEKFFFGWCGARSEDLVQIEALQNLALVVDGDTLHYIISKKKNARLEALFLALSRKCRVVVACRSSPGQKAQLVEAIQKGISPTPVTLAIGDGANDVPMIEKGHVGVGISGKEGTQATNAADFSISQFRFLAPLLIVHGRYGYIRVAKAIVLTFYANLLFTFVSFYYNFVCRFSGTPAFTNIQYVLFQAFIAIPVFAIGFLDRDFKDSYDVLKVPEAYKVGRENKILRPAMVYAQISRGLVHGAVAFLLVFYNSLEATYLSLSGALFIVIVCVLTVRQAFAAAAITWLLIFAIAFNLLGSVLLVVLINEITDDTSEQSNIFVLGDGGRFYWNQVVATIFIVALLDWLGPIAYNHFFYYTRKGREITAAAAKGTLKAMMGEERMRDDQV